MKTYKIVGIALLVVIVASVVTGTLVFAQSETPEAQDEAGQNCVCPPGPGGQFGGPRGGRRGPGWAGLDDTAKEIIAEALGLTPDELQAQLDEGKRLAEIAEEQGVEASEIQAAMKAVRVARIEQAVADGKLTQEQADQILERMEQAEQIAQALQAMREAQIEQALADGIITEEQAELLRNLEGKGFMGLRGRGGFRGPGRRTPRFRPGGFQGPGGCVPPFQPGLPFPGGQ